jgi:hypothetical protein
MDFLTKEFIRDAMYRSDEAGFAEAMALLNRQNAPVDSNPVYPKWKHLLSPISHILNYMRDYRKPGEDARAAEVIFALYSRCGCRLERNIQGVAIFSSDLGMAVDKKSFEVFKTLLVRCFATFGSKEGTLKILFKKPFCT